MPTDVKFIDKNKAGQHQVDAKPCYESIEEVNNLFSYSFHRLHLKQLEPNLYNEPLSLSLVANQRTLN